MKGLLHKYFAALTLKQTCRVDLHTDVMGYETAQLALLSPTRTRMVNLACHVNYTSIAQFYYLNVKYFR